MEPIEQIRGRLSIEEVVGQYVQLKKSGRSLKGLCPFHQEKSPSFIVSPDKGIAYCFGCRKGGDIFAFVQEIEQCDFKEALKTLADRAGVPLADRTFSATGKQDKERMGSILEDAQQFFQKELEASSAAQQIFAKRGYDLPTCRHLSLGYSPQSFHRLTELLLKKGYHHKDILDSGMGAQKEVGDQNVYDRFRHRLMFPIRDTQGRLVAFGGRTLETGTDTAKYLNGPESKLYHKGQTLYLYHLAKASIRDRDRAIVVEGYFDALTSHIHGFTETVASLGTALTEEQLKLIGRMTNNLLFAFDADPSGQSAASRSIEIAQGLGMMTSVIIIPSGKDPDETLRTSPADWAAAVEGAIPAMTYEFEKAFRGVDRSSLSGKKAIIDRLFPIIGRFPTAVEQEHYLKNLAFELGVEMGSLMSDFSRLRLPTPARQSVSQAPESSVKFSRFEHFVGLLQQFPELLETLSSSFRLEYCESDEEKRLYKNLIAQYNRADELAEPRLQLLGLFAEDRYRSFSKDQLRQEILSLCQAIRQDYKRRSLQQISAQLRQKPEDQELYQLYQNFLAERF